MSEKKKDIILRGQYGFDPAGAAVFCGLRGIDPFLQHYILKTRPLDNLFEIHSATNPNIAVSHPSHPVPRHTISADPPFTAQRIDGSIPLSPYKVGLGNLGTTLGLDNQSTILWSMSLLSATKHIYTYLFTSQEIMYPSTSVIVGVFNSTVNTLNSLFFTLRLSNPTYTDPSCLYIGAALFAIGILVEPIAETQRYLYKKRQTKSSTSSATSANPSEIAPSAASHTNPAQSSSTTVSTSTKSKSKPYTGGLFSLARNINYGAYVFWRTGYALAGGGWIWGAFVAAYGTYQFAADRIPILEQYMREKYGEEQWREVEEKVKYRLFPGIY